MMLSAAVLLVAACSSLSSFESSPVTGDDPSGEPLETPTDGIPTGDTPTDDTPTGEDPQEPTITIENPDDVFDPETVPEVPMPALATPEQQVPELDSQVIEAIAEAVESPDIAILDVAGVVDDGPTDAEIASFRDGNTRSGTGELIVLDQRASLACANVEIALQNLDDGDIAAAVAQVTTAADRSRLSNLSQIRDWSSALAGSAAEDEDAVITVDPTILVSFLSVCVDGGHAL